MGVSGNEARRRPEAADDRTTDDAGRDRLRRRGARGGGGAAGARSSRRRCSATTSCRRSYGGDVWLKREDLTPGALLQDPRRVQRHAQGAGGAAGPARFVCASAGNHAQGMAFACRHFGVEGVVFMPVTTPQQKIDKTRQFGGGRVEIRLVGDYFDATLARGAGLRRRGRRAVPAALRRRRRDRGAGDLRRLRSSSSSPERPISSSSRSAAAGSSAASCRCCDALAPGDRGPLRRAGRARRACGGRSRRASR